MKPIINHFTDNDLYTFTCQYYILETYPRAEVEYTFFDRNHQIYPKGFDALLREQLDHMAEVRITDEEVEYMKTRCVFLPLWYFTYLRGYRFRPGEVSIRQDEEGHLDIRVRGKWFSAIMWEMPILSCISELMHGLRGDFERYDAAHEEAKARAKTERIFGSGLVLGDMGTRRRFSFAHHDMVVRVMKEVYDSRSDWPGKFTGTSNVWLAMKYDCVPLGTMSHQLISFEENVSGVFECNFNVMKKFSDVYDGDNGIYLYDCFGDEVFFSNLSKRMAMMYKGLRVDSGDEFEQRPGHRQGHQDPRVRGRPRTGLLRRGHPPDLRRHGRRPDEHRGEAHPRPHHRTARMARLRKAVLQPVQDARQPREMRLSGQPAPGFRGVVPEAFRETFGI